MLGGLAAIANERFNATGRRSARAAAGRRACPRASSTCSASTPRIGRTFTPAEDKAGAPNVAVIGRRYWMRRFGGDPTAIGATLTLNGAPYTVVGALGIDLPPPFDDVDVWAPRVDEITGFPTT